MSRITGSDAQGLMEAYASVYYPQELTEDQVWEEVEAWVNSLVEEGHDLSEYTWEEMYEEYLNEMGQPGGNRPGGNRPISNAPYQSRFARPMNAGTPVSQGARRGAAPSRVTRPQIGSLPANYRGQELQQTAAARASQVGTTRQGTAGGPTVGGNTPIGSAPTRPAAPAPTRPAAPAPTRPAAPAPTRPAAPAPTRPDAQASTRPSAPAPSPSTQTTTSPTPAAATPRARDTSISDMIGRSQIRQGAPINTGNVSSDIRSRALRSSVQNLTSGLSGSNTSNQVSNPNLQKQIRQRRLNMDFDPFDIVQGYLIDEGYAETEEAASVIMANMSEEWRQSIVESIV